MTEMPPAPTAAEIVGHCEWWIEHLTERMDREAALQEAIAPDPAEHYEYMDRAAVLRTMMIRRKSFMTVWEFAMQQRWPGRRVARSER